jgi:hypothetical protein
MLAAVRNYLRQRGQATLGDIALHFDVSPEVARQMLEIWIRKGKVRRTSATPSCGTSCSQCDPVVTEIYSWMESDVQPVALPPDCGGR